MTSAAAVSAVLRRAGFRPLGSGTSRSREGLRVSSSNQHISVCADLDSEVQSARMSGEAANALVDAGYRIDRFSSSSFWVSK